MKKCVLYKLIISSYIEHMAEKSIQVTGISTDFEPYQSIVQSSSYPNLKTLPADNIIKFSNNRNFKAT